LLTLADATAVPLASRRALRARFEKACLPVRWRLLRFDSFRSTKRANRQQGAIN
jgi:hypothetical protein